MNLRSTAVGLLAVLLACGGDGASVGPKVLPEGVIVSHPVPHPAPTAQPQGVPRSAVAVEFGADSLVYASLVPGTAPTGVTATVRALASGTTVTTAVQDGGFDPVPVTARVGDTVTITVRDGSGVIVFGVEAAVTPIRRIRVVRTDPAPGKRDQPLNANIVIVFSDPVDPATLTAASVQLFRGGTVPVAGTVNLLAGTATAVVFTPTEPLDPSTDYSLVVTTTVQDITGGALDASVTVSFRTGTVTVLSANFVTVSPDTTALAIGWQGQLTATARDTNGTLVIGRPFTWSSDDLSVATVSAGGLVTALAEGVAHVQAEMDGRSALATIKVSAALAPVASVEIVPGSAKVVVRGLVQLTAILRDADGIVLPYRTITWQSGNPAVDTVSVGPGASATVVSVSAGSATVTATSEGKRGTATIRTGTVGPYTQIAAYDHPCALAADASAWCWGNGGPPLGNGTDLAALVPVGVAGGLRFSQVTSSCALSADSAAYCWGYNYSGELGIGNAGISPSRVPVAVSGARRYASIDVAGTDRCALTAGGAAYCWGSNDHGELGVGTTTGPESCDLGPCSTVPVPVVGGHVFTSVTVGDLHACGLTASGFVYCWGLGGDGSLGTGSQADEPAPALALGPVFVAVSAGGDHTCGLTADGSAYCWGANDAGQLGIGSTAGPQSPCLSASDCSTVPVPVAGGRHVTKISAGTRHTCAITAAGTAYCWGEDSSGQLGNGSTASVATPAAVAGGLVFANISSGFEVTCAITPAGVAYCWGAGGQLGNGSTNQSNVPVRVAGQP